MPSLQHYASRIQRSLYFFSALRYPLYRRYWLGNLASVSGQQMLWVAQGWLIFELSGSALYLGYAGLATATPAIFLNLIGGVLADRLNQQRLIIAVQTVAAALIAGLATLTALDLVRPWHILVVAFCIGALQAFNNPARQSIFPYLLDRKDLMHAISLNSMVWQGTRIIAPATGGVLIAVAGTEATLYCVSLLFIAFALAVASLKVPPILRSRGDSMLGDMTAGLGFIRDNSVFAFLIGMTFFNSFFGAATIQIMPVFAREVLDVGAPGLGLFYTAGGIGSLVGVFVAGSLGGFPRKGLLVIGGAITYGSFLILFAVSPVFLLSLAALALMGAFNSLYTITIQTLLQMRVPDELRGRVMGVYGMTWNMGPMGALQTGAVADAFSPRLAVSINGLAVIAFAIVLAVTNKRVRRLEPLAV